MASVSIFLGYSVFLQKGKMAVNFTPQTSFCFDVINDIKSLGTISQEIACAMKICLYFVVSSVAVISVYLKMMS